MKQYVGDTTVCSTDVDKSIENGFYTSSAYTGGSSNSCTKPVSQGGVKRIKKIMKNKWIGTYVFSISSSGSTTKLSTNFQLGEFKSPDNADGVRVSPTLVTCLQNIRTNLQVALYIETAYETTTYSSSHNGGATQSYHMSGTGADVYITGDVMTLAKSVICQCRDLFVSNSKDIGLGLGDTFVHVDMRSSYSSWVEAGAKYTASQWQTYIYNTYNSCSGKYPGINNVATVNNADHTSGCSGNGVKFPNTCLTPVYYTDSKYKGMNIVQFFFYQIKKITCYNCFNNYITDPNNAGESLFSAKQSGLNTLLSNNFAVKEFVCKDGSDGFRLAPELVQCLQAVRDTLKSAVYINSAYRTVTHNADEGGAQYSRHMSGTAADAYSSAGLWNYANAVICKCRAIFQSNGQDIGLGLGGTYIHADMRPYYSYWIYSDASMTESAWNNYIMSQWSKCSTSSRVEITDQDYNEDQDHTDEDTGEGVETDTVDGSAQSSSSSSSGNDSNNTNVIVPVVVVGALVIIALIAYFTYRRVALNRKSAQQRDGDIPLTNYVHLQDA
ncbi:hypothetical protein RFI_15378 [Reticulomyxa filosa]|uniref:Peptidase M15A C-terminal domain-containing protein n=1 Tax=Reticulomyxa filosa TaxID=46433 RepID=X6N950_RETFI|nr:hypothetical protein RFI_15378 [Reticulomyxa filosa]|eukprot:ETO21822.1 hypothetical protein RFI_15378 [Reticulomyxa filosa]